MNWSKDKISSFADVVTGGTPSTTKREYWEGGTIPWINSGDLNQGLVTKASDFITDEGYKSSSTKLMPKGTVLIALTGATTGLTALLDIEACANQSVTGIFPSSKHHPEFLYYYLRTQREKILNEAWGGAQPHINQKYVKDFIAPLPDINDQIKISSILIKAEELIKRRKESIRLLDDLLKSIFLKMFGNPSRNIHNFPIGIVRDLVQEVKYGTSKPSEEIGKYTYLRMNNITFGGYWDFSSLKYINIKDSDSEKYVVKKGDLIFNRTNSKELVGKTAVFDIEEEMVIAGYLIRVRTNKNANPWYIWGYLNSRHGKQTLIGMCKSIVGMANINAQELQEIPILLPPVELQNAFAQIVEKANTIKKHYSLSLLELEKLFSSLSQKAFSGKLNLSNLVVTEEEEYFGSANDRTEEWQFNQPKTIKVYKKTEKVKTEAPKVDKRDPYNRGFNIGKRQYDGNKNEYSSYRSGHEMYVPGWKESSSKEKVGWEKVSSKQIAEWVENKYKDSHFSSEMLVNFLINEHVTFLDYYSSEDLKKKPHLNGMEDLKSFVFSALNNENPFLKLEQHFYDAETENFILKLNSDDYQLILSREKKERSGIYFSILKL